MAATKHTIVDIARRAGVGVATASRALNNAPDVSPATRERVLAVAAELNYYPSATARRLQGQRTNIIACVFSVDERPANDMRFKDFISILAMRCAHNNLDLLIHPILTTSDYAASFTQLLRGRRVDGLIVTDTLVHDPRVDYLVEQRLPFVAFGRTNSTVDYPYVDVDSQAGVYAAMTHLIMQGHERIAFLGLSLNYNYALHRFNGYREALAQHDLSFDEALVANDLDTETTARMAVQRMLQAPAPPSAFVAASDVLALHAMRILEDFGFRPGRDVALVGFDDLPSVIYSRPSLTTVRQPFAEICDLLLVTLIGVIKNDPTVVRQSLVQPELVIRQSSMRE